MAQEKQNRKRTGRKDKTKIDEIFQLIKALRGENGCPWDRKQTPKSISVYLIEEMYELVDAIESGRPDEIREELGDVIFQVLFLVSMYEEFGYFDFKDVVDINIAKMTRRHPHVFGQGKADCTDEVRDQWHKIKSKEKKLDPKDSILDSIPIGLPALMRAYRISERAARAGFDWSDISGVNKKLEEEWSEFKSAVEENKLSKASLEFGDVLFTLTNVARFARIHPETALSDSIKKFENRFKYMEKRIKDQGMQMESVSQQDLDMFWEEAKRRNG